MSRLRLRWAVQSAGLLTAWVWLLLSALAAGSAPDTTPPAPFLTAKWTPQQEQRAYDLAGLLTKARSSAQRLKALEELERLGPVARFAVPEVIAVLEDRDAKVKAAARRLLQDPTRRGTVYFPGLVHFMLSMNAQVSSLAVRMVFQPQATDLPTYVIALKDPETEVRARAALAFSNLGLQAKAAAPALGEAMMNAPDTAGAMAYALFKMEAERELLQVVQQGKGVARERAQAFLVALYEEWLSGEHAGQRAIAARQLGEDDLAVGMPDKAKQATAGHLVSALKDRDAAVRTAAAGALVKLGAVTVPALAAAIEPGAESPGPGAVILKRLGSTAVPELHKMLQDVDSAARIKAAALLGLLGAAAKDSVPVLTRMMADDPDTQVRLAIEQALQQIANQDNAGSGSAASGSTGDSSTGSILPLDIEQTTTLNEYSLGPATEARWLKVTKQTKWGAAFTFGVLPPDVTMSDVIVALYNDKREPIDKRDGPTKNFLDLGPGTFFFKIYMASGVRVGQPLMVQVDVLDE